MKSPISKIESIPFFPVLQNEGKSFQTPARPRYYTGKGLGYFDGAPKAALLPMSSSWFWHTPGKTFLAHNLGCVKANAAYPEIVEYQEE